MKGLGTGLHGGALVAQSCARWQRRAVGSGRRTTDARGGSASRPVFNPDPHRGGVTSLLMSL